MNAVDDVLAKHGVLPATATKGRAKAWPVPAVSAEDSRKAALATVKVGDRIEVKGNDSKAHRLVQADGVYEVEYIDTRDQVIPFRVKLKGDPEGSRWVKASDFVRVVTPEQPTLPVLSAPTILPVRGDFLIHVDIATILANREKGEHKPVAITRRLSDVGNPHVARELAWDGPSRFVHHEFMKIEGTEIQNWIETDVPVTCWRENGVEVMTAKPGAKAPPMTAHILGAFVIHIAAPVLIKNRQEGRNDPVIAVRRAHSNWATDVVFARRVEWTGPTRMVHRPSTPVPGTNGRGVAFVETDADVICHIDNAEPLVLSMPRRAA